MSVTFHLIKYLINNNLNETLQSTHKSGHSFEIDLAQVKIILWCQLIKVSQYYLFFWICLLLLDKVDQNVRLVFQVKYMIGFDLFWNNGSRECLFMVYYLTFR